MDCFASAPQVLPRMYAHHHNTSMSLASASRAFVATALLGHGRLLYAHVVASAPRNELRS